MLSKFSNLESCQVAIFDLIRRKWEELRIWVNLLSVVKTITNSYGRGTSVPKIECGPASRLSICTTSSLKITFCTNFTYMIVMPLSTIRPTCKHYNMPLLLLSARGSSYQKDA